MDRLKSLKLVENKMDTSFAEEFIKNNKIPQWPDKKGLYNITDPNNLKPKEDDNMILKYKKFTKIEKYHMAMNLAKKIEENAEQFAQLEYLVRGTDQRDVVDGHVKLMSQYLRCSNALWGDLYSSALHVKMTENTPLLQLAKVAGIVYSNSTIVPAILVENENMSHICRFFVQLCRSVGFEFLLCADIDKNNNNYFCPETETGCTGVITEGSDLDSAIYAFVQSSKTAPWRLDRVYVEESIFEDFKNTLSAIADSQENGEIIVGDKSFLIEFLEPKPGVIVEAYRTAKELLSMLATPFLSIWCGDSTLSNELAIKSKASTIWVNDYASFDGPPRSALSVFKPEVSSLNNPDLKSVLDSWSKLTTVERTKTIIKVIEKIEDQDLREFLLEQLVQYSPEDFVQVSDKSICFGIQQKIGVINLCTFDDKSRLFLVIKALLNGNGIAYGGSDFQDLVLNELFRAGVPILNIKFRPDARYSLTMEGLKVIRTNYGTIFAN